MKIQRISDKNIHFIPALFKKVFGYKRTLEFFRQKYASLYGLENFGFVAIENDQAIALCAAAPMQFTYGNRIWKALQILEGLTDPAYRGKGLFTRLNRMVIDLAREENLSFIISFPNYTTAPFFFDKLGYREIHRMHGFVISTGLNPVCHKILRLPVIRKHTKAKQNDLLHILSGTNFPFKNPVLSEGFSGVLRDEAFYDYKKFSGSRIVEIDSVKLWLKADYRLQIGEIEITGKDMLESVLNILKTKSRSAGIHEIVFQTSPGTSSHRAFNFLCKPFETWPVAVFDFNSGFPFEKLKLSYGDVEVF
jgi:GNAT superfamily N-acetyltransferase